MKLYYMPGACSLATHIVLREAGEDFTIERVAGDTKQTESGEDFRTTSPNGYVPALRLDDDEVLTEGVAIMQYIADRHPDAGLAPENGTLARTRLQEQLNFIATELHKSFSPLFNPASAEDAKKAAADKVRLRLGRVEEMLSDGRDYLLGERFSVADAYLFTVANWTGPTGIGLDAWPHLAAFSARVAARAPVQAALKAEGLLN